MTRNWVTETTSNCCCNYWKDYTNQVLDYGST